MKLPARWTSLEMIFRDILYLSYRLPAARVHPWVMPGLPLATVDNDVFVTAMFLRVEQAKMARIPSPRWSYTQAGIFTYVRPTPNTQPAAFCIRQALTHPRWVRLLRLAHFPVELAHITIQAERTRRDVYTAFLVQGQWHGDLYIQVRQTAPRLDALPPFSHGQDAIIYLTDALTGYYRSDHTLYRLDMWHPRAQPRVGTAETIRFPLLQDMFRLTDEELAQPAVVLMAPRNHYLLHLPPRKEKGHGS